MRAVPQPGDLPINLGGRTAITGGLVWYSPCGYQWRDLFVTATPIPRCPQCGSQMWSTTPYPTTLDPDPRHVPEDPVWRKGYYVGRFDGAWAEPVWRRIIAGVALAFVAGVALGWFVATHG